MPQIIHCPGCGAPLRVREELAGKNVKCPKCAHVVPVPRPPAAHEAADVTPVGPPPVAAEPKTAEAPEEVRPAGKPRMRECPSCGERNPVAARKCRYCRAWLDEDEPEAEDRGPRRRRKTSYVPCPKCGARGATRVTWTIWGSFYGPAMFNHVRCPDCGYKYNGRTGRSNLIPAIIFITIPAILIAAILGFVGWLIIANVLARRV
jgi:predicted Zn finger-like uncharacterized protein